MSSEKRLGNLCQDAIFSTTWVCRGVWWFNGVSASASTRSLLFHSVWWRSSWIGWPRRWHLGALVGMERAISSVSSYDFFRGVFVFVF